MSAFEGEMLVHLKARLNEFMDLVEKHDDRCIQAKTELIFAQDEFEKFDLELHNAQRRIELLQVDYKGAQERLAENEKKLKECEEMTESVEKKTEELDELERKVEDELDILEKQVAETHKENKDSMLAHLERKKVVTIREVERLVEKADNLQTRATLLEQTMEKAGTSLMECGDREEEALDREDLSEAKIEFLEGELYETENRADAAERSCQTVERGIMDVENEVNLWKKNIAKLVAEVTAMDQVIPLEADVDEHEMKAFLERVKHDKEHKEKEQKEKEHKDAKGAHLLQK